MVYLIQNEAAWAREKWRSLSFVDQIAGLLTLTDWKKCNNTQNMYILLDGCYPLFEEYLQDKTSVYILKPYQEIG